jgi:hypothetical protein
VLYDHGDALVPHLAFFTTEDVRAGTVRGLSATRCIRR